MGQPSYLCSVLFARAPVLGLCFFVSVKCGVLVVRLCVGDLFLFLTNPSPPLVHRRGAKSGGVRVET